MCLLNYRTEQKKKKPARLKAKPASTLTSPFNRADPSAGNRWSMLTQRSSSPQEDQAGLAQQTQPFRVLLPSLMPDTGTHSITLLTDTAGASENSAREKMLLTAQGSKIQLRVCAY